MTSLRSLSWAAVTNPCEAVNRGLFAGYQSDGKKVYVARFMDENGSFLPTKIVYDDNLATCEDHGFEKSSGKMDYLLQNEDYEWIKSSNGTEIANAVLLSDNYIGRALINGTTVIGKVDLKAKHLMASYHGKTLNLKEYDVLVLKSDPNRALFTQVTNESFEKIYSNIRSGSSVVSNKVYVESSFNKPNFLEMQHKIQTLELELSNARRECRDFEQRLMKEERKNQDIQKQIQVLKVEKSTHNSERLSFEEKLSSETSKVSKLEFELQKYENETVLLLKKVAGLEEALRAEKYQLEVYTSKFKSSLSSSADNSKIKNLEDRIKNQQQKIFELEMLLEDTRGDSDSFRSRLTSYESTIEQQKIQVESMLKKLQGTNADKEYLIQQVTLLTQNLKQYQFEIETMAVQLKNAKSVIATLTAELGRSNGQLSKFQAALSNSYLLNGELMTKVSNLSNITHYKSSFESKFDLLNINLNSIDASAKAYTYSTPSLLEATGSETYTRYIQSSSDSSEINPKNVMFTKYTAATVEKEISDNP